MEMVRGLLVDVDVARPGRDEGDAVRDVRSGEWDDAFVDRLRPGLVAPEADKGEKLVLTMPGSISVTRTGWPGSPILRTSMRARGGPQCGPVSCLRAHVHHHVSHCSWSA